MEQEKEPIFDSRRVRSIIGGVVLIILVQLAQLLPFPIADELLNELSILIGSAVVVFVWQRTIRNVPTS